MIRAVIFDIGGVLIRTTDHRPRRAWDARLGLAPGESEAVVFGSEMGTKAQRGTITDEALWDWVGQHLGLDQANLTVFRQDFWAGDVLDTDLVDFIRTLRPRYQTAVISNATDGLRVSLTDQYQIADAFDLIVTSAEEKIAKPEPEIFIRTLARLGRAPEEAVFVDDFAHNIEAARALGLHTIRFRPGVDVPAELAQMGVTP
ncbi:MAG: HAD family phosphatase [Ardenticatenaceae bacterium]|nr:HAD family phosphatase [Ardenticatenaceae bacterium]MCB8988666.1 HAD family phosphatase [Ardenticatenaceae bacterium]